MVIQEKMHETYANMEAEMHETYANIDVKMHETYANVRFYSEKRETSKLRMEAPSPMAHVIGSSFFKGLTAIIRDTSWQKIYGPNFQQMTLFHLSEYWLAKWG